MKPGEMKLSYVPLSQLEGWPGNPKNHDLDLIRSSIERFGFNDPMSVDGRTQRLLEGHGRLKVLRELHDDGGDPPAHITVRKKDGEWLVPIVEGVSFETDQEAEAYLIGHNRSTELGGWDEGKLREIFKDLAEDEHNSYEEVGFTTDEVESILEEPLPPGEAPTLERSTNPSEQLETYLTTDVKQIVLYAAGEEFDSLVDAFQAYREEHDLETNSDVLAHALEAWEATCE